MKSLKAIWSLSTLLLAVLFIASCTTPQPGPDKTIAGAVLGAGWGAGAGAVIGNQVRSNTGPGAVVGAGLGAVSGAIIGASEDLQESSQLDLQEQLDALQVQTMVNRNGELSAMLSKVDRAIVNEPPANVYTVYFGDDETDLRSGASANLETVANALKGSPRSYKITVSGHTDDSGNTEYNEKVAESRARSVASYLSARGISNDQILVKSYGSTRPLAPNTTPEGRQLNRRVEIFVGK